MSFLYINPQTLTQSAIQLSPFRWCSFQDLIYKEQQTSLFNGYPLEHFVPSCRLEGSKKNYQFNVLKLIHQNKKEEKLQALSASWQTFVAEISSTNYIQSLFHLFDIDQKHYQLDISLFRFKKNDWVEPHVDHPDKLLTQLFYFNPIWEEKWGGLLLLQEGWQPNTVFQYFKPCVTQSIALKRMENAWHSVTPITNNAKEDRLTLQVEIWR